MIQRSMNQIMTAWEDILANILKTRGKCKNHKQQQTTKQTKQTNKQQQQRQQQQEKKRNLNTKSKRSTCNL